MESCFSSIIPELSFVIKCCCTSRWSFVYTTRPSTRMYTMWYSITLLTGKCSRAIRHHQHAERVKPRESFHCSHHSKHCAESIIETETDDSKFTMSSHPTFNPAFTLPPLTSYHYHFHHRQCDFYTYLPSSSSFPSTCLSFFYELKFLFSDEFTFWVLFNRIRMRTSSGKSTWKCVRKCVWKSTRKKIYENHFYGIYVTAFITEWCLWKKIQGGINDELRLEESPSVRIMFKVCIGRWLKRKKANLNVLMRVSLELFHQMLV